MITQSASANKKWVRTKPAADHIGSTESSMEKMRLSGGGPPYSKIGRIVVYEVADLDRWVESRKRISTTDAGESYAGGDHVSV